MNNRALRNQNIIISRFIIIGLIVVSTSLYFWQPTGIWWIPDILFRTYILFICGVMGHEGSHGVLANSKNGNIWWGRASFIPLAVPNVQFRITHRYHHSFTNMDGKDPDLLLKMDHWWQFPGRALAMPHHWVLWMKERGLLSKSVFVEWIITYLFFGAFFGTIVYFVGWQRVVYGLLPAQILNSFLLWYPFAVKTHEGHSTGHEETRSHDYYGSFLYWLTLGLSMHRAHHMHPQLGWLQLKPFVQRGKVFKRHIIAHEPA
jgi:fatty acid desaturase